MLYTITVLKGQYQPGKIDPDGTFEQGTSVDYIEDFKNRAREKRFIVREFSFDPTSHATNEEAIAELSVEVDRLWSGLIRWCKAHFGETFIAWMHIKVYKLMVSCIVTGVHDAVLPLVDDSHVCRVRTSLRSAGQLCRCNVPRKCCT